MKAGPSRRHNFTQLLRRESGHKGRCKVERHPSKARGGPRPEVERARLAAREIKGLHLLEEIRGNQQKAAQERKDRVWQCGSVRELWLQTAPPNLMSYRMAPSDTSSRLTALACQGTATGQAAGFGWLPWGAGLQGNGCLAMCFQGPGKVSSTW